MALDRPARFIRLDGTHFDRDLREYAPVVEFAKPGETRPPDSVFRVRGRNLTPRDRHTLQMVTNGPCWTGT